MDGMVVSDEERQKNREMFCAIYKNECKKVAELFKWGVKLNTFDRNNKDNTPLHYAIEICKIDVIKLLVNLGADITIKNVDNKTPLELAFDSNDQNIINALIYKVNVPGDGSCLFWAAALPYLTPVTCNNNLFKERCEKLFGSITHTNLEHIQQLIITYDFAAICNDEILRILVTERFRERVICEMSLHKTDYENFICVKDLYDSKNTDYFVSGRFHKKFCDKFNSTEISSYNMDINKLKPSTLIEASIQEIDSEFDKILEKDRVKLKQFMFESYLECMIDSKAWGGNHELNAIRHLLQCNIYVLSNRNLLEIDYDNHISEQIFLFNDEVHYEFGLLRSEIGKIQSNHSDQTYPSNLSFLNSLSSQKSFAEQGSKNLQAGTYQGGDFELFLFMLFIISEMEKCVVNKEHSFTISAPETDAKKFNDVVLKYRNKDNEKYQFRLLQAKHSSSPGKITVDALLGCSGEFSLMVYCNSYIQMKQELGLKDHELEDLVLATNRYFEFDSEELRSLNGIFHFTEIDKKDDTLNVGNCKFYKFDKCHLEEAIYNVDKAINDVSKDKKIKELKSLLELTKNDATELKKEIGLFLEKLVFAANLPKEDELEIILKNRMKSDKFKFIDIDLIFNGFKAMVDRETRKALNIRKLSKKCCEQLFLRIEHKVQLSFINIKKSIDIKFTKQVSDLKDFLRPPKYILNLITTKKDKYLSVSQKICHVYNTVGEITKDYFRKQPKAYQVKILKLKTNQNLMIIQKCSNNKQESKELYCKIFDIMKMEPNLKLVLISQKGDNNLQNKQLTFLKFFNKEFPKFFSIDFQSIYTELNVEDFDNYSLYENTLKGFLTPEKQIFNLTSSQQETTLSVCKVFQTLEALQKIFIFKNLNSLLDELDTPENILPAFESETSRHLLLIECKNSELKKQGSVEPLYNQLTGILSNSIKKIVLITKKPDILAAMFKIGFADQYEEKENNDNNLTDLIIESQIKLLENVKVTFQGEEVSLGTLISEESKCIIDGDILSKLIDKENIIEIGQELSGLGDVEFYYIDRVFRRQSVKCDCLQATIPDLFAISNIAQKELFQLVSKNERIRKYKDSDPDKSNPVRFIILDDENEQENFSQLISDYPNRRIHWLKMEYNELLIWKKSKGSLLNLHKYFDDEKKIETFTENEFIDKTIDDKNYSKVVIISAEPGMGKSTVFTNIAKKIKNANPSKWVIRLNLFDISKELSKADFSKDNADEFLVNALDLKDKTLEKAIFLNYLNRAGGIVLFLDGFDESCPNYKFKVIDLLKCLTKTQIDLIFVSTRVYVQNVLVEAFNILPYHLDIFSLQDQKLFLTLFLEFSFKFKDFFDKQAEKFKAVKLKSSELGFRNNSDFDDYDPSFHIISLQTVVHIPEMLIESFSNSFSGSKIEFLCVPLHLQMLAEYYVGHYKPSYFKIFPFFFNLQYFDLLHLYEFIVDEKHNLYQLDKRKRNYAYPGTKLEIKELKGNFVSNHKLLAVKRLFKNKDHLELLLNTGERSKVEDLIERIICGEERSGIISKVSGELPDFVHVSFAEYFVAEIISDKLRSTPFTEPLCYFFINTILFDENYQNVRRFFDTKLTRDPELTNFTTDSIYRENVFEILLEQNEKYSKSSLYLAVEENFAMITAFLFSCADDFESQIKVIDISSDKNTNNTPLRLAVKKNKGKIFETLLECVKYADRSKLIDRVIYFVINKSDCKTILDLAVENNSEEIVDVLFKFVKGFDAKRLIEVIGTALYLAVKYNKTFMVNILPDHVEIDNHDQISNILNFVYDSKTGKTLLHLAAEKNSFMSQIILDYMKTFDTNQMLHIFSVTDCLGRIPASYATENINFEFFLRLESVLKEEFKKVCPISSEITIAQKAKLLYIAIQSHNDAIADFLLVDIENNNQDQIVEIMTFTDDSNDGNTALHVATGLLNTEIMLKHIRILNSENRMKVFNATGYLGKVPAHNAAEWNSFEFFDNMCELLGLENFYRICETCDVNKKTPLDFFGVDNLFRGKFLGTRHSEVSPSGFEYYLKVWNNDL